MVFVDEMLWLTAAFLLVQDAVSAFDPVVVSTASGKVQGSVQMSYTKKPYVEFLGIPYAQPPVGKDRFEDPKPIWIPWNGVWVANTTSTCLQVEHWPLPNGRIVGDEDCLHLDIFVPGSFVSASARRDVIVHFHDGSFSHGGAAEYAGPQHFMDRDVVLVVPNYRVGVAGFLSTGDLWMPGNRGLKDQVEALRWVKRNIKYFGGDEKSVTLTGLGAGGASVHFHYLSWLSQGLFARGISVSGTGLNGWALQESPLEKARIVGRAVGCTQENTYFLKQCLASKSGAQLNNAVRLLKGWLLNPLAPLGPVVEALGSLNPFFADHPYKLLLKGKAKAAPWIVTSVADEGLYPAADFRLNSSYLPDLDQNWQKYAPDILDYKYTIPDRLKGTVSKLIRDEYLGNKTINVDSFPNLVKLITDRNFLSDIVLSATTQAKNGRAPVYYMHFAYQAKKTRSFARLFTGSDARYGVCHGDDMMLLFSDPNLIVQPTMDSTDEKVKNALLDAWIAFARSGNPDVAQWSPLNGNAVDEVPYMFVDANGSFSLRFERNVGNHLFWLRLPFDENAKIVN